MIYHLRLQDLIFCKCRWLRLWLNASSNNKLSVIYGIYHLFYGVQIPDQPLIVLLMVIYISQHLIILLLNSVVKIVEFPQHSKLCRQSLDIVSSTVQPGSSLGHNN